MSNIEALIFDMDGVVLESHPFLDRTKVEVLQKFGVNASLDLVREYSGNPYEVSFPAIAQTFGVTIPLEKVIKDQRKRMEQYYYHDIPPVPHVKSVLEELSLLYKLGLATTSYKNTGEAVLKRLGLLSFFEATTFWEDIPIAKPDPAVYLETARKLKAESGKTAAVEDTTPGFRAVKAAGMLLIARKADHNQSADFSLANYVIEDLREIPKILTKL